MIFNSSSKSQMYALKFGFQEVPVYCHMGDFGCGNGGWTLTMKIDGTKGFASIIYIFGNNFQLRINLIHRQKRR